MLQINQKPITKEKWFEFLSTQSFFPKSKEQIISHRIKQINKIKKEINLEVISKLIGEIESISSEDIYSDLVGFNNYSLYGKEICENNKLQAFYDWDLLFYIFSEKISEYYLDNIKNLLHIPEKLAEKLYHLKQGLKYLKSIYSNKNIKSDLYDKALNELNRSLEISSDYLTLKLVGQIYFFSYKHFNLQKAVSFFIKSTEESLTEFELYKNSKINFKNKFNEDYLCYEYYINPYLAETSETYLLIARCFLIMNDIDKAIYFLKKILDICPNFITAKYYIFKLYLQKNNIKEANLLIKEILIKNKYYLFKILTDKEIISNNKIIERLYKINDNLHQHLMEKKQKIEQDYKISFDFRNYVDNALQKYGGKCFDYHKYDLNYTIFFIFDNFKKNLRSNLLSNLRANEIINREYQDVKGYVVPFQYNFDYGIEITITGMYRQHSKNHIKRNLIEYFEQQKNYAERFFEYKNNKAIKILSEKTKELKKIYRDNKIGAYLLTYPVFIFISYVILTVVEGEEKITDTMLFLIAIFIDFISINYIFHKIWGEDLIVKIPIKIPFCYYRKDLIIEYITLH